MVMDCNSTCALITMSTSLTLLSCWLNIAVVSVMHISEGGYVHHPCCFQFIKGHKIPWDFILCEGHVETYKNSYQSIISYAAAYTLYSKLWLVRFGSLVVVIALIAKLAKTKKHFCNSKLLAQLILLPCSDENNILQISIQLSCVILLSIKKT